MTKTMKTRALNPEFLNREGFIRYKNSPVAYVKNNLSVLLLLPPEELKKHPYYSAAFNGFIELDSSVSLINQHFTLALIAEWGAKYFGAPSNKERADYVKAAVERLTGAHTGAASLAASLAKPMEKTSSDFPLSKELTESEIDRLAIFSQEKYPIYIVNGFWSGQFRTRGALYKPTREASQLITVDDRALHLSTSKELLVEMKIDDQHREKLLGICIREVNADREITGVWFIPKHVWRWFMYQPEEKHFLTSTQMWKYLPHDRTADYEHKALSEVLDILAWSQDVSLDCSGIDDVVRLLLELNDTETQFLSFRSPLAQLFVDDKPLNVVIRDIEALTGGKHTSVTIDDEKFLSACAAKAYEFQGEDSPAP